ncbi:SAM-dependent methyltransferase [Kangiella koreensis]|uniref:Cyclopropane-fatty-acyl-phospholipid synthase n=1 Tax=Kangiella koreensis (strain DSM 16069 / JCM 12317 / KCTC 12182 / SW-125) TaxID=523791 RepID=C7R8L6_KANKD|nr:cyclopropane-fatty-acyl-phospholipid synthase family protein [Kangiella koreensis]ACV27781.1 Cyclopropane-fatty-acyl-phospholipid synthase [Kangiella koreensis DSM 16069]
MIAQAINLIERGLLPDRLVRLGIRKLCEQRLAEESAYDCEAQGERYHDFLQELKSSEVAIKTDKANEQHYEVPAQFYHYALGKNLKYSSAYWPDGVNNLDAAEQAMLELYAERGEFVDGQDILELGCGWGSLTMFLAAKYPNSTITGVSNSNSQREYIEQQAKERGLSNITIITQDINQFDPGRQFDRIISIEMFEHVRNYEVLFERVSQWLKDDGKVFLHVFCHRYLMYPFLEEGDDNWMGRYFFSGGQMPAADTFLNFQHYLQLDRRWLVSGQHYEKTSNAWLANMDQNHKQIMPLFETVYGKDLSKVWFQRWRIFFMACAELFGYADGNEWMVAHYRFVKR